MIDVIKQQAGDDEQIACEPYMCGCGCGLGWGLGVVGVMAAGSPVSCSVAVRRLGEISDFYKQSTGLRCSLGLGSVVVAGCLGSPLLNPNSVVQSHEFPPSPSDPPMYRWPMKCWRTAN